MSRSVKESVVTFQETDIATLCSFQDDEYVVFPDIKPAARHHYLIVTREHIASAKQLSAGHKSVGKCTIGTVTESRPSV
jgi:diadenosine tetraphosphate (Ap4A) HIT family hydrolase